MFSTYFWILFLSMTHPTYGKPPCIGAIIRPSDDHLIVAFQFAVQWVKQRLYMREDSLDLRMKMVDPNNFYQASKLVCDLAEEGCVAIFGPPEPRISNHLEALTDQLSIPYFKIHWACETSGLSINLSPQDHLINAIIDLVIHWNVNQMVIVYKDSERLTRLKLLLESRKLSHLPGLNPVRLSLIKIDNEDFLLAANRLGNADTCTPHSSSCPVRSRRVLLDLDSADVHKFLLAIGSWSSMNQSSKVTINSTVDSVTSLHVSEKIKPHHLLVTTIEENPYVMVRKKEGLVGNEMFEGFCIDLLNKLTEKLPFTYTIHVVKDKRYGNEVNGTWDGMIGEILRGEADMAVAPLTVTYKRAQVVDFTKPFLSLGISILYRIPGEQQPSLFSFMNPLSMDIWLYILVAVVTVTGGMFIIARITPYEWNPVRSSCYFGGVSHHSTYILDPRCPAPPPPPPVELLNQFSFRNTAWYVASTLMKGGSDIGPRAVSSRLLGGIWWVFSLVIVSAYTANLAAVLTVDRRYIPIKSMEDLANQSEIFYGAVSGGSTIQFFKVTT